MYRNLSLRLLLAGFGISLFSVFVAAQDVRLPLSFEPNQGQSSAPVQFLSHGKGYGFFLTDKAAVVELGTHTMRLEIANGQIPQAMTGEDRLPGTVNYLRGSNPERWLHNVPTFARVRMEGVYPGVDLVYYGNRQQLEYDFVVHAGARPAEIALRAEGARLKLEKNGGLAMESGDAKLQWHAPVAYQEIAGKRVPVKASYEIAGETVRFRLGAYDHGHDLVIDPALVYSTYLGGNGGDMGDVGNAIAVDSTGAAYVAGMAASTNYPVTAGAMQPASHGDDDAFVSKLNPQGTAFEYSTYLGGGGQDMAWAIAVDAAGNAYVAGQTGSGLNGTSAFPTTAGAYQRTHNAGTLNNSVFVAKVSADGKDLLYSTLLSGANDSFASGIAVDGGGNAYILTNTAAGFPVTSGAYQKTAGTYQCPYEQFAYGQSQVVTKVNATGSGLGYSTYVGHGCDYGSGIAVNSAGQAYITGYTQDAAYPVTSGALQAKFGGVVDGFVTHLNASGSGLMYSTFLGGSLADFAYAIALDSSGYAYVTGGTDGNFRTTTGAYKTSATNNGYRKGFVAKISPLGKALIYSTYVTSANNVTFNSIAVDKSHYAYVAGWADGAQYPVTASADQGTCHKDTNGCLTQAVVTKFNATGNALLYSSYFGASDANNNYFPGNIANGIAADSNGGFYITGRTSNGLKTTPGSAEANYRATSNSSDAFVAKFNVYGTATSTTTVKITSPSSGASTASTVNFAATASGGTVAYMQVYVDGVRKGQVSGSSISTALSLTAGKHRLTAQAIDKDGTIAKATIYVTAQ